MHTYIFFFLLLFLLLLTTACTTNIHFIYLCFYLFVVSLDISNIFI